jgi:hypothetical protein
VKYSDIIKEIEKAISRFNDKIPEAQKAMFDAVVQEVAKLDTSGDTIKPSVKNLQIIARIKNKLTRLILSPQYNEQVREFAKSFNVISNMQNEYWKQAEASFRPTPLLNEIKKQSIQNTIDALGEQGIGVNIANQITNVLKRNITTGGSMGQLTQQLRENLLKTKTDGALLKYTRQITTDAINQYSAQYNLATTSDIGFTWYAWQNTEVETSRPFCQAMVENHKYFHISSIPNLLQGRDEAGALLEYTDNITGNVEVVTLNPRTNLPYGFIEGTNEANFLINRGGYQCGHQPLAIPERNVSMREPGLHGFITSSEPYKRWVKLNTKADTKFATEEDIDRNLPTIKANGEGTFGHYREVTKTGLKFTREREALHNEIIKDYTKAPIINNGEIFMTGGAPANGKSTVIDKGLLPYDAEKIMVVDSDRIKGYLPEYQKMVRVNDTAAAAVAHEESSYLSKKIINKAIQDDTDFVLDGVGDGEYSSLTDKIKVFKSTGKRVRADYVTLDTDLSVKLATARAQKTGREVPLKYILDMNREISKLVPKLIEDKILDQLNLWDTNINGNPRLILTQKDGKLTIYDQKLYDDFLKKALR